MANTWVSGNGLFILNLKLWYLTKLYVMGKYVMDIFVTHRLAINVLSKDSFCQNLEDYRIGGIRVVWVEFIQS